MSELCTSYIDGKWTSGEGAERIPVISPIDETQVAEVAEADANEVDRAVRAARAAFERGAWRHAPVAERQRVLRRIAALIRENADELAQRECANAGLPMRQIRERHVQRAAANFEFFADFIGQTANESYEQEPPFLTIVRREPVGIAALVAPWNAPLALATMEMAGAIAFGNCFILKPSELTPLEFVPLLELMKEAGMPDGVAGLVNGRGPVTGAALVGHPDIDVVAFIGGTETGRHIARSAGGNLKKYVAELGGKSANIITPQCDLERALDAALVGIFSNNGQQCLAGSRILVDRTIAKEFIANFVARAEKLKVGDPRMMETEIGPVISKAQYDRVLSFAADANVLTGGKRAEGFDKGFYVAPTVALAEDNSLPLCQEEIFGPFATFLTYDGIDQAIEIANQSEFGLVAYLWCDHMPTVMRAQDALQAGTIWVNTPLARDLRAPFGGYKNSGVGRTGGLSSRNLFTEEKVVTMPMREFPIAKLGQG
ncbi:aldehyde dehydrogenase family protein [Altererythrobacter arenosus]|uniref:Aldehyde dehydrogenase family protein n=1 Tax=Altererythrobacter arenosus TaxID=3032592 RepID=A0ABY8FMU7_9SPHN|nr:aldehyde dehydrogenase family protein [Altererythrobacter sp. CAU 1644]WFL76328.1 aldehyde dehydrogenase family protein [Altererythrobacter sp. CAU 1644]